MVKTPAKDSVSVNTALVEILSLYGDNVFKTITNDNGSEFAHLSEVFDNLKIYYAHPNSSFERDINQKQNSLVHRFFPK